MWVLAKREAIDIIDNTKSVVSNWQEIASKY